PTSGAVSYNRAPWCFLTVIGGPLLWFAVIHREELELVPRDAIEDGVVGCAVEKRGVGIGLPDERVGFGIAEAQADRSGFVPDDETILLCRFCDCFRDGMDVECVHVHAWVEAKTQSFRDSIWGVIWVV